MTTTTGYQAGVEANQVQVSYAQELAFGVAPAVAFQAIRLTAESLSSTKTRTRPTEFNLNGEVVQAVTTKVTAGGQLTFALSFGTFDALIAGGLNSDWTVPLVINGVGGDISITGVASGVFGVNSATAGKFNGLAIGNWVRLTGFTNPVNNGVFRVKLFSAMSIGLVAPAGVQTIVETPAGAAVSVKQGSSVTNSTAFRSFFVQKRMSASLFFLYPGCYVSDFTVSGGVGKFLNGTFTLMSQAETNATADSSTGSVLAAPSGRVHDPVGGFGGVYVNGLPILATVDNFSLTATNTGAAQEFGMGSAFAQGIIAGLLEVKGTLGVYFKDFTLYSLFISESANNIEFLTRDAAGNAYIVSVPAASLMDPKIVAGSQNTAVMATFTLEGNPLPGGGTFTVWRL